MFLDIDIDCICCDDSFVFVLSNGGLLSIFNTDLGIIVSLQLLTHQVSNSEKTFLSCTKCFNGILLLLFINKFSVLLKMTGKLKVTYVFTKKGHKSCYLEVFWVGASCYWTLAQKMQPPTCFFEQWAYVPKLQFCPYPDYLLLLNYKQKLCVKFQDFTEYYVTAKEAYIILMNLTLQLLQKVYI